MPSKKQTAGLILGSAAVIGAIVLATRAKAAPTTPTPPGGTQGHWGVIDGVPIWIPADPYNVFMYNPITKQQGWIPNAAVAAYLAGGWIIV